MHRSLSLSLSEGGKVPWVGHCGLLETPGAGARVRVLPGARTRTNAQAAVNMESNSRATHDALSLSPSLPPSLPSLRTQRAYVGACDRHSHVVHVMCAKRTSVHLLRRQPGGGSRKSRSQGATRGVGGRIAGPSQSRTRRPPGSARRHGSRSARRRKGSRERRGWTKFTFHFPGFLLM